MFYLLFYIYLHTYTGVQHDFISEDVGVV